MLTAIVLFMIFKAGLSEMRHAENSLQGNSFENILKTSIRLETAETLIRLGKLDDAAFIVSSLTDVPHESHTLTITVLEQITSIQILSGILLFIYLLLLVLLLTIFLLIV